jgi:hypothetical protein
MHAVINEMIVREPNGEPRLMVICMLRHVKPRVARGRRICPRANIHFYGTHSVDGELAKLDSDGYRPLRGATATEAP